MRFGLTILPEHAWPEAEPRWRAAEELGFDHAWTFDHVTWAGLPDSPWFAAVPTLAAAAAVTSRIGLGTFVTSPNNHHPVQLVREVLALDDISRGRLLLGIGTGGDVDARIMGEDLPLRDRVARFHEFTGLLDRLLREDHVTAQGRFYTADDVRTLPGPLRTHPVGDVRGVGAQANRVPLVIAANGPKSVRLAVDRGDGWLTYGGSADTDEAWWQLVASLCGRVDEALEAAGRHPTSLTRYLNLDSAPTFSLTSPAAFEDAVGRAADLGFTDVITHWPRDTDPFRGDREVLERVAADVIPGLRGEEPASATPPDGIPARRG
ncbi:MAG: Luciferase-like, subgroup [Humibacillus sp.]|nr:Luciferase-like, subgroup [Humibacillus sp.]